MLTPLGLTLLHAYAYEDEQAALRSLTPDAVARARNFVSVNLGRQLDLRGVARAANVTPQHLTKLFRRHLHITPMRYVWDVRARRGLELLTQTGLSVGEIAERCGFQTPFHFSRLIHQRYGASPSELRRRAWRADHI
jgi:transcriptional regulator GlxA family with amidase domain